MIKRTPSRNTRSRGFKVKHVLQIGLLLGVCFWLLYQVKHSHDKKKEFDEKDTKISVQSQNGNGIVDIGRKGLHPRFGGVANDEKHEEDDDEETITEDEVNKIEENKHEEIQTVDEHKHGEEQEEQTKTDEDEKEGENKHDEEEKENDGNNHEEEEREEVNKHEEEEREEEGNQLEEEEKEGGDQHEEEEREEEEEGNKHGDEEQEEETKRDDIEDDGRGRGDDEIDEHDQQKIEGEVDQGEDLVEEKEREEEGTEKESGNDDSGDNKEDQVDREVSTEDLDQDGGTQDNHEAQEVLYRADDASSAVTHDTQNTGTEPEKISSDSLNENAVMSDLGSEKNSSENNRKDINGDQKNLTSQLGEGAVAENDHPLNVKTGEEKGDETINTLSLKNVTDDQQLPTNKSSDVNTEAGENPTDGSIGTSAESQQNETLVTSDWDNPQNKTVDGADNVEASNLKTTELGQVNNNTVSGGKESNSTSTVPDRTEKADTVAKDSHLSTNSELNESNTTIKSEVTAEEEVNSGSMSITNDAKDTAEGKNSDIKSESGGTDDNSGSSTEAELHDQIDSADSSIGQDVKEARINLDTLPENIAEAVNSRDTAAE